MAGTASETDREECIDAWAGGGVGRGGDPGSRPDCSGPDPALNAHSALVTSILIMTNVCIVWTTGL